MAKISTFLTAFLVIGILVSCNIGPKEVGPFPTKPALAHSANPDVSRELHKVIVQEVLSTSKYVYLRVKEGEKQFWIASRKQAVNIGDIYFYREALLRVPFESKERNKVFDTLYLVTKLVPADHAISGNKEAGYIKKDIKPGTALSPKQVTAGLPSTGKGYISIAELTANPDKYRGQQVQLRAECVKVNKDILNRNWLHLKDGSKDSYDLIITSDTLVPVGTVVAIRGDVAVDKDFGAGYRYGLILENGVLLQP